MRKRFFERKPKGLPKGYDSKLEYDLHMGELSECKFHDKADLIPYIVEHTYEPDLTHEHNGKKYIIEIKGRFRESAEARKYVFVNKVLKDNEELVFLFQAPTKPMPFAKVRKDGTKRSHKDWADKHGFRSWSAHTFKMEYLYEGEVDTTEDTSSTEEL